MEGKGCKEKMNTCGGHFDFLKGAKLVYKHCFIGRNIVCNFGEGSYFSLCPRKGIMKKIEMAVATILFFKRRVKLDHGLHLYQDASMYPPEISSSLHTDKL